jgi:hypothetical protein
MAERFERLTYKINFDAESGTATIRNLDGQIKATMISTQKLRQEYGNFATQIKATDAEIENLRMGKDGSGGMQGLANKTGAASAAALELGRVVSDAPYGIRGMANNVSQLASNVLFMSQKMDKATGQTIGFMGAVKDIGKALAGPLGLLLAIQAVIAAIDYFAGGMKKAEEATKSFDAVAGEAGTNLKLLRIAIQENMISQEDLAKAIKGAEREYEDLNLKIKDNVELDKQSAQAIDDKIAALERLAKAEAIRKAIEEEMGKLAELSLQTSKLEKEAMDASSKAIIDISTNYKEFGTATVESIANTANKALDENKKAIQESRNNIKEAIDNINKEGLWDELFGGGKSGKKRREKTLKEFKKNLLDLSSELNKYRQTEIENADISEEERLKREYDASRKAIENKRLEFKDKEDARLDARLKEIADLKVTEEEKERLIEDAYTKYNDAQIQANKDLRSVMLQADIAYYSELATLRRKDTEDAKKQTDDLISALRESNYEYQEYNEQEKINAATNELDRIQLQGKANETLTNLKIENLKKEALEEGKTAADIQEINNKVSRLQHDQTLAQQELDRKAAATKLAIANQVANAIINIAGEGSTIAKGVAIAQTIWNTKQGVMNALGTITPYGPWNIAQAAAIAAMGVKNVADIIATKAPNEKSSGVSASAAGGGGTTFMPDFNIVGASGTNQLASTVAGQLGEPTRAYVVYDDLRTAGEIEANAVTAAGI